MNKLGAVIAFLAGIAIGGVAAWHAANERYAKISEEDILSVKEAFRNREQKLKNELEELKMSLEEKEYRRKKRKSLLLS